MLTYLKSLSLVQLLATPWTVVHGLYSPWNSPGQNTGRGSPSFLQGIFPTQGSNPGILHCRQILYQLSHKGSQEYWSGWSIPSPVDLPNPEIQLNEINYLALQLTSSIGDLGLGHLILPLLSRFSHVRLCAGSPVPGILQARTLEWVAISFSNA